MGVLSLESVEEIRIMTVFPTRVRIYDTKTTTKSIFQVGLDQRSFTRTKSSLTLLLFTPITLFTKGGKHCKNLEKG